MLRHYFSDVSGALRASINNRPNNEGFSTTQALPDVELAENEYFAMLDENGKVNMWPDKEDSGCTWQVKTRFEKVTAYNKETQQPKEFADETLVTEEYTTEVPESSNQSWDSDNGCWVNDEDKINLYNSTIAQSEMVSELNWVDLQLKYHASGDTSRAVSDIESLYAYAINCRDYVQNIDGILTIVGDKPVRPE